MAPRIYERTIDYWRKFFRSADDDIFLIILCAIRVAKADHQRELIAQRQTIINALYPRDQLESDQAPEVEVQDRNKRGARERKYNKIDQELKEATGNKNRHYESEDHADEIDQHHIIGEVMMIKRVLRNWSDESDEVIFDSLRRLQLMEPSLTILNVTDIGSTLSGLQQHSAKHVRQLARILIEDWKLLAAEWMTTTLQDCSPSKEENWLPVLSGLPSSPMDVPDIGSLPNEFCKFVNEADEDLNPRCSKEFNKNERVAQMENNNPKTKGDGEERMHAPEMQPSKPTQLADKPPSCSGPQRLIPQALSEKSTVGSNTMSRQEAGDIPTEPLPSIQDAPKFRESSYEDKIDKSRRKTQGNYIYPVENVDQEMVINSDTRTLKPVEIVQRAENACDTPGQLPRKVSSQVFTKKASGSGNTQKRQVHTVLPSDPTLSTQYVSKLREESSCQHKLEMGGEKWQQSSTLRNGKVMTHGEASKLPKLTEIGRWSAKPRSITKRDVPRRLTPPIFNQKLNINNNTQKSKRQKPADVPPKVLSSVHEFPDQFEVSAHRDKIESMKRESQESYQALDNAKKQRTTQVLELKDPPIKGQKEKLYQLKFHDNACKDGPSKCNKEKPPQRKQRHHRRGE